MEINARYTRIGAFTLAVVAAGFVFVYWLNNAGGLRQRAHYQIRFENTVSGLLTGAAVLFNGIRVGEVSGLQLSSEHPRQVTVTISIEPSTPVRADTQIEIDFQGLAGAAVVSLKGGEPTSAAIAGPRDKPPLLIADGVATQSMTQAARDTLRRLDTILADNAEPLRTTLGNLNTFSAALARNSDRFDGIVAGLERMTGGAKVAGAIYDLHAPKAFPPLGRPATAQLVVPDPTSLVALETQRLLVRNASGGVAFGNGQWSDNVAKLFQAKIIESLENSGYLSAVGRPMDGLTADYQLLVDVRSFHISAAAEPVAEVEFAARLLDNGGRIAGSRVFAARVPAPSVDAPGAITALDEAFGKAVTDLVVWAANVGHSPAAPKRP
jgi:phospholipid/cholesterol/gamma-HCH transport system substrate-binding protein